MSSGPIQLPADEKPPRPPGPGDGRWSRAAAYILVPVAVALTSIRLAAMLSGANANETGYAFGRLVLGPVLFGVLIWLGITALRRRRNPVLHFFSPGLAVTIALLAIYIAYSSAFR